MLISDFIHRSVKDPNKRPYSIINILSLPTSLIKKIINEYKDFLDKSYNFKVIFFADKNEKNDNASLFREMINEFNEMSLAMAKIHTVEDNVKSHLRNWDISGSESLLD